MRIRNRLLSIFVALLLIVGIVPMPTGIVYANSICRIVYEPGEGTGSMPGTFAFAGSKLVLPECGFTAPEGKRFDRWHIAERDYELQTGMSMPVGDTDKKLTISPVFEEITNRYEGDLPTGQTWELVMTMKKTVEGTAVCDPDGDRFCGGELTVAGEGELPDFTAENKSPWDEQLSEMYFASDYRDINVYFSARMYARLTIRIDDRISRIGSCFFTDPGRIYGVVGLPGSLKTVGDHAFHSQGVSRICFDLDGKELPEIESIGDYAFANCGALTSGLDYPYSDSQTYDFPQITLTGRDHVNGTLILPDSLAHVGEYAFANTGVYEVKLPHGMTAIPEGMFKNCCQLNMVWLPDCLETIGDYAFAFCGMDYLWAGANGYGSAEIWDGNMLFVRPYTDVLGEGETVNLSFPETLTALGKYSFRYCNSIRSARIPENVTEIPEGCFGGCSELTDVELPEGLTAIRANAFDKYCQGKSHYALRDLYVPASVTVIEDYAFGFKNTERHAMDVYGFKNTAAEAYVAWANTPEASDSADVITFHSLDEDNYFAAVKTDGIGEANFTLHDFEASAAADGSAVFDMPFTDAGLIAVKRFVKDKDGEREIWYALSSVDDPGVFALDGPGEGETAPAETKFYKLTEVSDPALIGDDGMIEAAGFTRVRLTLIPCDEIFVMCELFRSYTVCGDLTDWNEEEFVLNGETGLYEYEIELAPGRFGSFSEFTIVLNGVNYYSAVSEIFDNTAGRLLMTSEEIDAAEASASDYRLYISAAGTYKFVIDCEAKTLSVESGNSGYFLCFDSETNRISGAMIDPVKPEDPEAPADPEDPDGEGEDDGYNYPDEPAYLFEGEATVWASMRLGPNEVWNEQTEEYDTVPYNFFIRNGDAVLGKSEVRIDLDDGNNSSGVIELSEGEYLSLMVDETNRGVYDFYFGAESHKLVVVLRPGHSMVYSGDAVLIEPPEQGETLEGKTFDWYVSIPEGSLLSDCGLTVEFDKALLECTGVEWFFEGGVLINEIRRMEDNHADELDAVDLWEPFGTSKEINEGSVSVRITVNGAHFFYEGRGDGAVGGITEGGRLVKLTFRFREGADLTTPVSIHIVTDTNQWGVQNDGLCLSEYDRSAAIDGRVMYDLNGDYDGDGVIEAEDALIILRIVLAIIDGDEEDIARCDMNGDGVVDAVDALIILRKALGIIP